MRHVLTLLLGLALGAWPAFDSLVGQRVTLEGTSANAKLGAVLVNGDQVVYLDGLDSWAEGRHLRLEGKLISRDDLPVVDPNDPLPKAGVSGSPRRYLLTDYHEVP